MNQYIKKINSAAITFLSPIGLPETYRHIVDETRQIVDGEFGSIFLGDQTEFKRVYTSHSGLSDVQVRDKGTVHASFRSDTPVVVEKKDFAQAHPQLVKLGVKAFVTIPLLYQEKCIGVMTIHFKRTNPLDQESLEALKLIGTLASLAIQKTRYGSERELALRSRDAYINMDNFLHAMYLSTVKFFTSQSLEETYRTIVDELIKLVGATYGSILLESNGSLKRVYATSPVILRIRARKRGDTYAVFRTQEVAVFNMNKVRRVHPDFKNLNIQSIVAIPLTYLNKSIGVLTMHFTHSSEIDTGTLRVLKLFGTLASMAIKKNQLLSETKAALETRDLFISMAAHELRTPLTTIHGYAQLLQTKLASKTPTPEVNWSQQIYRQSTRLNLLINELLEVNRIRSGMIQYVWNECDIRDIINRAIANVEFSHTNREIVFDNHFKQLQPKVVGDFDRLLQVVVNLLDNALKFSDSTEPVKIILKKSEKNVVIMVADKGLGIESKDIPRILKGFYKIGDNIHREGLGLGLFLSNHTIDRHHGTFDIKSQRNKGTTVTITLPQI